MARRTLERLAESPLQSSNHSHTKKAKQKKKKNTATTSRSEHDALSIPGREELKAFEDALQRRDLRRVLWLLESGAVPVDYETIGGDTALFAAIAARDETAVRMILDRYASLCTSVSSFRRCFPSD
ncbi:hypothetical protein PINS_up012692 [Pythium insidiosum]|nr:hypothetical protein PINS_up012692 [Pythium insidiosum]